MIPLLTFCCPKHPFGRFCRVSRSVLEWSEFSQKKRLWECMPSYRIPKTGNRIRRSGFGTGDVLCAELSIKLGQHLITCFTDLLSNVKFDSISLNYWQWRNIFLATAEPLG